MTLIEDERFEWVRRRGGERYAAWLAAGYREAYCPHQKGTPFLLQKRVRDAAGTTLFFINTWAYDWSEFPSWSGEQVTFAPEVQFNTHVGQSPTFNAELLRGDNPADTEAFFLAIYNAMNCGPYGDD